MWDFPHRFIFQKDLSLSIEGSAQCVSFTVRRNRQSRYLQTLIQNLVVQGILWVQLLIFSSHLKKPLKCCALRNLLDYPWLYSWFTVQTKIECDDEYHRNCFNMFYKYFKDTEYIFIGYKSSKQALSVVVMDSCFKDIVLSKAESSWLEV